MVVVDGDGRSGRTRQVEDGTVRDQLADRVRLRDYDQVSVLERHLKVMAEERRNVRERLLQLLTVGSDEPTEVDVFVVDDDLVALPDQPLGNKGRNTHKVAPW